MTAPNSWNIPNVLANLVRLFELEDRHADAELLRNAATSVSQTRFDNWNGGTYFYTITIEVPPSTYMALSPVREETETFFAERIRELIRTHENEPLDGVVILPSVELERGKPRSIVVAPTFWDERCFRLFISHTSAHKTVAKQLQTYLTSLGISCFVAHVDIEPTKEWLQEIDNALGTMDAMLAMLTPDFRESNWTSQEVGVAIGRGILVLPLMLGLQPYGFMGRYQSYPGVGKSAAEISQGISDLVGKHPLTSLRYANCLVSLIENAWSWESVRKYFSALERNTAINLEHVKLLEAASKTNEKVREAWGVPEKINALRRHLSK